MNLERRPSPPPLLSIVVPTRDRDSYAIPAIRSLLANPTPQLEVVVQDNGDGDELERFASEAAGDLRLRYNRAAGRLDVIENFNRGAALARGEYVTFLGDDDGINPELVEATAWAKAQGLDAVVPSRPAQYWWPDHRFRHYGSSSAGSLELRPFSGRVTYPDPEAELRKCARAAGYHFAKLPRSYYGIVRRECLDRVKTTTGTYFPGPSPDLSGAVAVASFVRAMAHVDYPLFVPGSSARSTAGLGSMKKHLGELEAWPHLPHQYVRNWSELVPRFFAGNTIWGEDVVQALKATGRSDVLREFNVPLLHAFCVAFNPRFTRLTMRSFRRALRVTDRSLALGTLKFAAAYVYACCLRARSVAVRCAEKAGWQGKRTISGLATIEEATKALSTALAESRRSFARCA